MKRPLVRIALLALAAVALTLPAAAQVIPAGDDRWVTPHDGRTGFTFPPGDVESLCGQPASFDWDRRVSLGGVPFPGVDWDTVVSRLKDVDLCGGSAKVAIQVRHLHFTSLGLHETPCGKVQWDVRLAGNQPTTSMVIEHSSPGGGRFEADLQLRVAFNGTTSDGAFLGTLIYTLGLPDPPGGTPWSFGGPTGWRPGIDETETCFDVLREKAGIMGGDHVYFIENMIAQGRCHKRN